MTIKMMEFNVFIIFLNLNIIKTFTYIFVIVNMNHYKLKFFKKIYETKFTMNQDKKKTEFNIYDDKQREEARKNAITLYDDSQPEYTFDDYKADIKTLASEKEYKEFEVYCSRRDEFIKTYQNECIAIKNGEVIIHDKNRTIVSFYVLDNDIDDAFIVCPGQELKVYHV